MHNLKITHNRHNPIFIEIRRIHEIFVIAKSFIGRMVTFRIDKVDILELLPDFVSLKAIL